MFSIQLSVYMHNRYACIHPNIHLLTASGLSSATRCLLAPCFSSPDPSKNQASDARIVRDRSKIRRDDNLHSATCLLLVVSLSVSSSSPTRENIFRACVSSDPPRSVTTCKSFFAQTYEKASQIPWWPTRGQKKLSRVDAIEEWVALPLFKEKNVIVLPVIATLIQPTNWFYWYYDTC
jgi:hypothetical protein